jgi:hypothetical protein
MTGALSRQKVPAPQLAVVAPLPLLPPMVTLPLALMLRLKKRSAALPGSPRLSAQPSWVSSRTKMRWPLCVGVVLRIQASTVKLLLSVGKLVGSCTRVWVPLLAGAVRLNTP